MYAIFVIAQYLINYTDFGCHNSIRLQAVHFLNTVALTLISILFEILCFCWQKHYLFFGWRSSSLQLY